MGKMVHEAEGTRGGTGEIRTLDSTGDSRMEWDRMKPETVAAAAAHFEKLLGKGFLAFGKGPADSKPVLKDRFDPEVDTYILSPGMTPG